MSKDSRQFDMPRQVRLFVSSDCEACEQAERFVREWAKAHLDVSVEIVPVLSALEEVVCYQIFYTPALIIDDSVLIKQDLSVEQIADLLPD